MPINRFHDGRLTATVVVGNLSVAALYYVLVRIDGELPSLLSAFSSLQPQTAPFDPGRGTLPSFLHATATLVVVLYLLGRTAVRGRDQWTGYGLAVVALLGMEIGIGVTDPLDLVAILLAAVIVLGVHRPSCSSRNVSPRGSPHPAMALLISVSAVGALGSVPGDECARYDNDGVCVESKRPGKPIYMSYSALREAIAVEPARPLDRLGRLYAYGDYLFVNEVNEGIHVIDNREPAEPVTVGFIRVPGNREIAIRGTSLYADSYVDLVTLDLSDPMNVREADRQLDVFPYDAFQNIPYNISFSQTDLDQRRGVVVSYAE